MTFSNQPWCQEPPCPLAVPHSQVLTIKGEGQMQEPWTIEYQGALRPLWVPCFYWKVEKLTHLTACPSCGSFLPAVATSQVIHEPLQSSMDTICHATEVDIEKKP